MFTQKVRLLRKSFPKTWIRKLPLLVFKTDVIKRDDKIVAMCTTYKRRIILLCVDKNYRRLGLASNLIKRSGATKTDTYVGNEGALKMWRKNGFEVERIEYNPLGKRYVLKKR